MRTLLSEARLGRLRGLFAFPMPYWMSGAVVLALLLIIYANIHAAPFSRFQLRFLLAGTTTLAALAVGQTFVVISGGFDFSSVALLAFLNSFAVVQMQQNPEAAIPIAGLVLVIGLAAGAFNGLLVGVFNVQSIVATIVTFFIWSGAALTVLERPGGSVPASFSRMVTAQLFGPIPRTAVVIGIMAAIWLVVRKSRIGIGIYAVGSDRTAALSSGLPVRKNLVWAYTLAGLLYAIAALSFTATAASGDPRVRFVLLAEMFAAVVIGGTALGGGRGGAIGSIMGAFVLSILSAVVFSLGFGTFYAPIVAGVVLLLAVLPGSVDLNLRGLVSRVRGPILPRPSEG